MKISSTNFNIRHVAMSMVRHLAFGVAILATAWIGFALVDPSPQWLAFRQAVLRSEDGFQPGSNRPFDYDLVTGTSFFSTQEHAARRGEFDGRSIQLSFRPLKPGADLAADPEPLSPASTARRFELAGEFRTAVVSDPGVSAAACFHLRRISYGFPLRALSITTVQPWDNGDYSSPRPSIRVQWAALAADLLAFTLSSSLILLAARLAHRFWNTRRVLRVRPAFAPAPTDSHTCP